VRPAQLASLIALGAIWGSSFLFMKIAVPALGPVVMIGGRIGSGAIALTVMVWFIGSGLPRGREWTPALVIGTFYVALPLLMWGYASQQLSVSLLSIINATAPLFAALLSVIWLRQRITGLGLAGLALGFTGVALLVGGEGVHAGVDAKATLAAFTASFFYGAISNYAQTTKIADPLSNTLGSLWVGTLIVLPLTLAFPVRAAPDLPALASVATLGLLCTAVAYVVFFRLIDQIGAAPALTVTYLIPVFGTLWGVLFLGERLGLHHILGAAMICGGIALVARSRRAAPGSPVKE
jgi:drug/metabolite transporter (DMT)-like permease